MARILLIEDSPTQAQRLAFILEEAGFEVATAPDAHCGFDRLARERFDLVLSDLHLPGDSGFDLCRRLKADPRYRAIPIVVLTGQADPANVLRGLAAGADGFTTKDREPEEIISGLRRLLAGGPSPTAGNGKNRLRVVFLNQEFDVAASREQLANVLVSAFEDVVHLNQRAQTHATALQELNDRLQSANAALAERNQQLQQLADELAASVLSERQAHEDRKKAESQLVQSEKLASLGQLAAGLAHEINNPLAYVTNNVTVLQHEMQAALGVLHKYRKGWARLAQVEPALAAEAARLEAEMDLPYLENNLDRLLAATLKGLWRVRDIVKNLRDFARLDEADLQEANLNAGLVSTLEIVCHEVAKKQIQVQTSFEDVPLVLCQPGKLNQVFLNVLPNAIQACEPGGVIQVRTRSAGDAGVVVEIEDNGCGIPPEHLPHIFDPFFTTKPVGQGTGLGLSISYGIIRDHDGALEVESTPGRGSLFRIRLPLEPSKKGHPEPSRVSTT